MCALTILSTTLSIIAIAKKGETVHVFRDKLIQQSVKLNQQTVTDFGVTEVSISKCNAGWFHRSSACYFVSRSKLDWFGAAISCREHGARLLEMKTALVEKHLENSSVNPNEAYWLGARNDVIEGRWVWSSGAIMNFTKWNHGEPNGGEKENCLILENNGWTDHKCNEKRYFICQHDIYSVQFP
ncbi:unnamed protein product [Mytilus coruscus]|uniref:C-type lectin domain-containing protein n=1 Tax=Mytilus coruscus TaxID=42192 RepID=A0A6J8EI63_MYTCO|nr:unnamed protein product [Mytilus coruscus]